jgi:hypothetical protein
VYILDLQVSILGLPGPYLSDLRAMRSPCMG